MGSGSNAERSGSTKTRLKRAAASTIPRVAAIVVTQAVRTTKTHN
jgi:hypothetical protein